MKINEKLLDNDNPIIVGYTINNRTTTQSHVIQKDRNNYYTIRNERT